MRTLIYKRTHHGDPDVTGQFGICDCMGSVRRWDFDAVIGVGGVGPEPRRYGLDGKVNWIGIGPHKKAAAGKRGPIVSFDHFIFTALTDRTSRSCEPHRDSRRSHSLNHAFAVCGHCRLERRGWHWS